MTQKRWDQLTTWPLNIAAIVFLVAYSVKVISDTSDLINEIMLALMIVVWAAFTVNFIVNLVLARDARRVWFRHNWYQLLIILLPALNPLRLLRLITLSAFLLMQTKGSALRSRVGIYVISTLIILVYVGSLMVLDAEQNAPGANIRSFGDALWWSVVTVTTVGYGDFVPVTLQGRFVAAGLMLSGVALIGIITGTLASYLGERSRAHDDSRQTATAKQVADLSAQISALEARLAKDDVASDDV